jgi:hypothetical protein
MNYTATYTHETILGEPGWSWWLSCNDKVICEGWSRGKKRHAEQQVRIAIAAHSMKEAA